MPGGPAPGPHRRGKDPRAGIYRSLAEALRSYPGTGADSPAARIGVASWEAWFPGRHLMSEAFYGLRADFALNDAPGPDKWVSRDMLRDLPFAPGGGNLRRDRGHRERPAAGGHPVLDAQG
ncbi:hypothetical protein LVY72_14640 [Arthrobacter sp. I2-34]|uniref:Uncharacterized protein n=1 Tax=Arthrobacter hankyongi TaxID=2904801 RepID=A0ABS9L9I8_9MICC|nr:hypothetical protein [Arthrobacter hankyongi]MCG2623137.1 hypothetical protein [Arthrobacter hankyongi]